MKIRFTRTPPKEYSAYVEGEETENLSDVEARYLIGLGIAAEVRQSEGASTQHVSSRTEIVGDGTEVAAVLTGRGANIKEIKDPADAALDLPGVQGNPVATSVRTDASKEEAIGLVRQEASRTGGVIDDTTTKLPSAEEAEKAAEEENEAGAEPKTAAEREKAARAAKKAQAGAPENK